MTKSSLRVSLLGFGRVGSNVYRLLAERRAEIEGVAGRSVVVAHILVKSQAVNWVTFGGLSLIIGPLTGRFGARRMMFAGGCLFGLGILLSSQATSLWHLFILFGILSSVGRVATWTPLVTTVARWFERWRGLALGLAQSYNLGYVFVSPLAAWLVITSGWQGTFMILGALALLTVIPFTFLIREPPVITASVPQSPVFSLCREQGSCCSFAPTRCGSSIWGQSSGERPRVAL